MRNFKNIQTFVGISLGNQKLSETGIAILDKDLNIINLDKLYSLDDLEFFLKNLNYKEQSLILISLTDNALLLNNKWKLLARRYQLIQSQTNMKNIDDWQDRYAYRGSELFLRLKKEENLNILRYDIENLKMQLNIPLIKKKHSPTDCKMLQEVLKHKLNIKPLPTNMIPASQLEAILGAYLAKKISSSNNYTTLFNFNEIDVVTL